MNDIQRIFIAAIPDPKLHSLLIRARLNWEKDLQAYADVRWIAAKNLHLTLFFVGDVAESRVPELAVQLTQIKAPTSLQPLDKRMGLPDPRGARVLALGADQPVPALGELVGQLTESLRRLGFSGEERPFLPHVSLGRVKPSLDLSSTLSQTRDRVDTIEFLIRDFVIFKSVRHAGGSEYREIRRFPLTGSPL